MGHKVNSNALRYGFFRKSNCYWHADNKIYPLLMLEDYKINKLIEKKYETKYKICNVFIKRRESEIRVELVSIVPQFIIGRKRAAYIQIKKDIKKIIAKKDSHIELIIHNEKYPYLNPNWIAKEIVTGLEARRSYRIVQKQVIMKAMRSGAIGIKTKVSGRLNGVDISRSEGYYEGRISFNTLKNNVYYCMKEARTTYGMLGVKVWISIKHLPKYLV